MRRLLLLLPALALLALPLPLQAADGDHDDVSVTLLDDNDPVRPCEEFRYTINVRNLREDRTEPIDITLRLDGDSSVVSASDGGGEGHSRARWGDVVLDGYATRTYFVTAQADCGLRDGDILRAEADAGAGHDWEETRIEENEIDRARYDRYDNRYDNHWYDDDRYRTDTYRYDTTTRRRIYDTTYYDSRYSYSSYGNRIAPRPAICTYVINVADTPGAVQPGDTVEYRIDVRSTCNRSVRGALAATLSGPATVVSSSSSTSSRSTHASWNLSFGPYDIETVFITVRADATARNGDRIRLTARIGGASDTEDTGILTAATRNVGVAAAVFAPTTIVTEPCRTASTGLSVCNFADRREAQPGDRVQFTIIVRNQTSRAVPSTLVDGTFSTHDVLIHNRAGGEVVDGNTIRWRIDGLQPGEQHVFTYEAEMGRTLRHGDIVQNVARAGSSNGIIGSDAIAIAIIERLPQTGVNLGMLFHGDSTFLSPMGSAASAAPAGLPLWPIIGSLSAGLLTALGAGKRILA